MKMKNVFTICFLLLLPVFVFSGSFKMNFNNLDSIGNIRKGKINFSAGYGLGFTYPINMEYDERIKGELKGPFHLKVSYSLNELIELGVNCNYAEYSVMYKEDPSLLFNLAMVYINMAVFKDDFGSYYFDTTQEYYAFKVKNISFNTRINFHFSHSKKIDPYIGLGAGIRFKKSELLVTNDKNNADVNNFPDTRNIIPFSFELTAGLRYFPVENIGIYAEIGPAKSYAQCGIIFRY